uniref:Leucine-rich repeat-containing N-terminal plant-type domain-containing protein n=1 Tax=Grammatophora oceanica TaxID=210454 RepID=A0A7S1Y4K1_9STRA
MFNLRTFSIHNDQNKKGKLTGPLRSFDKCPHLTELLFDGNALSGSIPTNFLKNENRTGDSLVTVGLSDNRLTGSLPTTLGSFQSLNLDITNNQITGIPEEFCSKGAWQSGLVETFGCDAILCPAQTYAEDGRQTSTELICLNCPGAPANVMGLTDCEAAPKASSELQVLATLYIDLEGSNWKNTDGWEQLEALLNENNVEDLQDSDMDYCSWRGITCENQKIATLTLNDNRLVGTLPTAIWDLTSLVDLNLKQNAIELPSDTGFAGIGNAASLETLHLGGTKITSLKNLQESSTVLRLFFDGLVIADGVFPNELFRMKQLQAIRLSHAQMTGILPTTIGTLTALTELNLYANALEGKIPSEVGLLVDLVRLDLSESSFTGAFPNELLSLSKIQYLHIHQSGSTGALTGNLPAFDTLPALKELSLDSNDFEGAIPSTFLNGITDKSATIQVGLSFNKLSGKVPASLDAFDNMNLFLEGNKISEIDSSLCDNTDWMGGEVGALAEEGGCLAILCPAGQWAPDGKANSKSDVLCESCDGAQFMGTTTCGDEGGDDSEHAILDQLYQATGGRYWTMSDNWTADGVPVCSRHGIECTEVGSSLHVTKINLDNNKLKGTIPSTIFTLPHLTEIDFSNNPVDLKFDGIGQAASLSTIKLESTSVRSLANLDGAASSLEELHFQFNSIGGAVPDELFALTGLQYLFLSHNKFSGPVPTQFGELNNLRQLHVGANDLTGFLPTEVGLLVNIEHLDLQVNSLSGTIPGEISKLTNLASLQLGNQKGVKKLAGPLPSFAANSLLTDIALEDNVLSGKIPNDFLQNVDSGANVRVLLQSNQLDGPVLESLNRFENLYIDLTDNKIDVLSNTLCSNGGWMSGLIGELSTCNAILCPPGTASESETGRQTSMDDTCEPCPNGDSDAPYFGTLKCISSGTKTERKILIDIYNALNGTNWIKQDNWKSSDDKSVCTWFGITCDDNGAVSEINLVENNLEDLGSADAASLIFSLPHLTRLDIKSNAVKLDLTKIPTTSKLQILWLSGTGLEKVDGISHASDLRRVHLTDNDMTGSFPAELLQLTNLRSLYISFNQFSGELPQEISDLSNLQEFYMYGNMMSGTLPGPSIQKLTNLVDFIMADNFLTGTIPTEFNSMPNLEQFSLYDQGSDGFYGDVPDFSGTPKIWYFDVTNNELSGVIPSNFLQSSIYKEATDGGLTMYFKNNLLTGTLPSQLDVFLELDIDISGNSITGVPEVLCDNTMWMKGRVGDIQSCAAIACPPGTWHAKGRQETADEPCKACEHATDSILNNWGNLVCDDFSSEADVLRAIHDFTSGDDWTESDGWYTSSPICGWSGVSCLSGKDSDNQGVTSIDLSENNLMGTLPTEVFGLPLLSELIVSENEDLVVPLEFVRNAKSLEIIKLSECRVPKIHGIEWPKTVREIHITGVGLTGSFPAEILDLGETLEGLYIAYNAFSGPLPPRLGQLTMLTDFYAYDNHFSGTLPKEVGTMSSLENLVLAENLISGPLPSEISSLNNLEVFSCYRREKPGRKLTGPLPSFKNNPSLTDLYLDHNDITGNLPDDFLAGATNANYIQLQNNFIDGAVPGGLDTIDDLFLDLGGNRISSYPIAFCDNNNWMDGAMADVGCDSFLCPPGSSNALGRANATALCQQCSDPDAAEFYGSVSCDPPVDERTVLIQFYQDAGGSEWHQKDGWATSDEFCTWYGVECVSGSVQHLRLGGNNLVGSLNPEIYNLPRLQTLWVYSNPLEITFENIDSAKNLLKLRVDGTLLQHFNQIQNAVTLTHLNAEFIGYDRKFPSELLALTNLQVLELGNNAMRGELPEDLWQLSHLQALHLERNQFEGSLPSFEDLYALQQLRVNHNKFDSTISAAFLGRHQDDSKVMVDLSDNQLHGLIPFTLLRFDKLTLYLKNNDISGYGGSENEFCAKSRWNDGTVRDYGCDAIMCEPGTFSPIGRQRDEETACVACKDAKTYGAGTCGGSSSSATMLSVSLGAVVALLAALIIM